MHERCWSMMTRLLPEEEIKKHLNVFLKPSLTEGHPITLFSAEEWQELNVCPRPPLLPKPHRGDLKLTYHFASAEDPD